MMTVERQLILRVPVRPYPRANFAWEEEKGPKCLPVGALAGAMLSGRDSIDIVLRNRQRLRARLDSDCDGPRFLRRLLPPDRRRPVLRQARLRSAAAWAPPAGSRNSALLVPKIER